MNFAHGVRLLALALAFAGAASCAGGEPAPAAGTREGAAAAADAAAVYFCPMDLDIRSGEAGFCPRCGMALIGGRPDPAEYTVELEAAPAVPKAGAETRLRFTIRDPRQQRVVSDFNVVHEQIFHLFVTSQDLEFFAHVHPEQEPTGEFSIALTLPRPGLYQALADFYPEGGTPQLVATSFVVPGAPLQPAVLAADYRGPRRAENLEVELVTVPEVPVAGQETEMYFRVTPADGLERYLGAWGHMLAVSDDMIDAVHGHPFIADGGPEMLFHVLFPRPRTYRVWVQFQRLGVVNTVHFDVPVEALTFRPG